MPFLRNHLIPEGIGVDTFETAVRYSLLPGLREKVYAQFQRICPQGRIMAHISHSYSDGACVYFTMFFPIEKQAIKQWHTLKDTMSEAVVVAGGNISHHHGVGSDHKKYFKAANPAQHALLSKIKDSVDKAGILNPGKILS